MAKKTSIEHHISRREALKKLGKFTAYTAPVVTSVFSPKVGAHRAGGMVTYANIASCLGDANSDFSDIGLPGINHSDLPFSGSMFTIPGPLHCTGTHMVMT